MKLDGRSRHPKVVEKPELFVPDLRPAPSAYVDMAGEVGCLVCGRRFPLGDVEIVGLGFRCRACATRAVLDGTDGDVHLRPEERALVRREPSLRSYLVAGLVLLALATVMWLCHWDVTWGGRHYRRSLFVYVFIAGVGLTGLAWFRWLDRRSGH